MKTVLLALSLFFIVTMTPEISLAKSQASSRKVQEVNFGEMDLKGTIRNPDGAFLVQKRGIRFMPLHDIQKNFDSKIRESQKYMK
jgi:hypothetical protein